MSNLFSDQRSKGLSDPVAQRFDHAANHYDTAAVIQNAAAERFDSWLAEQSLPPPTRIIELGCGTGFLSRRLQLRYPHTHLHVTDLAPNMLHHCQQNLEFSPYTSFALADGRDAQFDFLPDWIVSTFCFQWFDDLPKTLSWHYQQTRVLAFSVLLEKSFNAWQEAHQQYHHHSGLRQFPHGDNLLQFLQTMPHQTMQHTRFTLKQTHANGLEFLRALKLIGATKARAGHRPTNLRPILQHFTNGFTAEYDIGFFLIAK